MHKILTFPYKKGYHRCLNCLVNDQTAKGKARMLSAVRSMVIPQADLEEYQKLFGKEKYFVSDEVSVRLHLAEEIPWGVKKIGAPDFWEHTTGKGVKVAVIDTGISRNHPDLRGQVKGRFTVMEAVGRHEMDGHGTHVAGIVAAVANNRGIVGVAPSVELYDVRCFRADGTANISDIVTGINWSIENGMDIINMSFGTEVDHPALRYAVKQAAQAGIVLVASAGNNGGKLEYPAAYREVVAVGAIDQSGQLAAFSSRGRGMNTVAPGVGIKSTWPGKEYRVLDGTSMAAAHISGLYALGLAAGNRRLFKAITSGRRLPIRELEAGTPLAADGVS